MNISQQFAPPFSLIAPFFIVGVFIYLVSMVALFGFDMATISMFDTYTLSWTHLYLLGFVMMIILGASAQLVPVVLETGHFAVDLYYAIYPLLFFGTLGMVIGFLYFAILLPFGGVLVLVAFVIFIAETILTITKVQKFSFIIFCVLIANIFLFFGLIVGLIMALGYSGILSIDIVSLLKTHVYMVFVGYVGITIMGLSLVLLPMFWLSHSFSWIWVKTAVAVLSVAILLSGVSLFIGIPLIDKFIDILCVSSFFLYFIQIFIIFRTRVRHENDIYFKAMIFSFLSLLASLLLGFYHIFSPLENGTEGIFALLFLGFVGFLISGHLYKIIPFLVWYERFSPLVGKEKVPMLSDMIPEKTSNIQFWFSCFGVIFVVFAIFYSLNFVYIVGVIFLVFGAVLLFRDVLYMINIKHNSNTSHIL